ncbi:hypothetical protein EYF80_054871 [Liparis tanakae]|uniref:Uncharacterized protein n=1 Tax=Liparis tanakae TaxID=230148 RepID=A0A4Z2F1F4_9TELE|nr:hypothetical protein EYF80_054871 [Liparis tanakae]
MSQEHEGGVGSEMMRTASGSGCSACHSAGRSLARRGRSLGQEQHSADERSQTADSTAAAGMAEAETRQRLLRTAKKEVGVTHHHNTSRLEAERMRG